MATQESKTQVKIKHAIDWFFKNKQGKWAVIQWPNVLLSIWIILLLVNYLTNNPHVRLLQNAVLFAWAYTELAQGDSYFRKTFGAVILITIVVGYLT